MPPILTICGLFREILFLFYRKRKKMSISFFIIYADTNKIFRKIAYKVRFIRRNVRSRGKNSSAVLIPTHAVCGSTNGIDA